MHFVYCKDGSIAPSWGDATSSPDNTHRRSNSGCRRRGDTSKRSGGVSSSRSQATHIGSNGRGSDQHDCGVSQLTPSAAVEQRSHPQRHPSSVPSSIPMQQPLPPTDSCPPCAFQCCSRIWDCRWASCRLRRSRATAGGCSGQLLMSYGVFALVFPSLVRAVIPAIRIILRPSSVHTGILLLPALQTDGDPRVLLPTSLPGIALLTLPHGAQLSCFQAPCVSWPPQEASSSPAAGGGDVEVGSNSSRPHPPFIQWVDLDLPKESKLSIPSATRTTCIQTDPNVLTSRTSTSI